MSADTKPQIVPANGELMNDCINYAHSEAATHPHTRTYRVPPFTN
jgi:hypothetical protein